MIKLKSVSDVITNSSSEVFLVKSDLTKEELEKEIREANVKLGDSSNFSGDGGTMEVSDEYEDYLEYEDVYIPTEEIIYKLPKGYYIATIDWSKEKVTDWFIKNHEVYDIDGVGTKNIIRDAPTGKIISVEDSEDSSKNNVDYFDFLRDYAKYSTLTREKAMDEFLMIPKMYRKKYNINMEGYIWKRLDDRDKFLKNNEKLIKQFGFKSL